MSFKNHDLVENVRCPGLRVEPMPVHDPAGKVVEGLDVTRIALDNQAQLNLYTTQMVRVILAMRAAATRCACTAVVFTPARACARLHRRQHQQYAEDHAGQPDEYRQ